MPTPIGDGVGLSDVGRLSAVPGCPALRRAAALALTGILALVVVACAGQRPELATAKQVTTTTQSPSTSAPRVPAEVAQATSDAIDIFGDASSPDPAQRLTAADATSAPTIPIVFLVKRKADDRLEVYLPVGANGASGWVRRSDVTVSSVPYRIEVTLREHRLRVVGADKVVLDEPVAVGRTDRPTPGGIYFLKELLQPPNPDGPYGPYVYGLSGSSTTLTSLSGGSGVVGIHGTNDDASVGADSDYGCFGLRNDVILRLVKELGLPLGTPVEVLS